MVLLKEAKEVKSTLLYEVNCSDRDISDPGPKCPEPLRTLKTLRTYPSL